MLAPKLPSKSSLWNGHPLDGPSQGAAQETGLAAVRRKAASHPFSSLCAKKINSKEADMVG